MKRTETFTHEGWFGICPVYIGDLDSECPVLTPRMENWFGAGLFLVSEAVLKVGAAVVHLINPEWEPGFPLCITGALLFPRRVEYDE